MGLLDRKAVYVYNTYLSPYLCVHLTSGTTFLSNTVMFRKVFFDAADTVEISRTKA